MLILYGWVKRATKITSIPGFTKTSASRKKKKGPSLEAPTSIKALETPSHVDIACCVTTLVVPSTALATHYAFSKKYKNKSKKKQNSARKYNEKGKAQSREVSTTGRRPMCQLPQRPNPLDKNFITRMDTTPRRAGTGFARQMLAQSIGPPEPTQGERVGVGGPREFKGTKQYAAVQTLWVPSS